MASQYQDESACFHWKMAALVCTIITAVLFPFLAECNADSPWWVLPALIVTVRAWFREKRFKENFGHASIGDFHKIK